MSHLSLLPIQGVDVRTEGELEIALKEVKFGETTPQLIEFHLDRWDCSPAMKNAGAAMRKRNFIPL
jgi:TPP-dependent 2-oxoacid decarboxylase